MPAIILVAVRDEVRSGGRHREGALEVPVEAQPLRASRDREALVAVGELQQAREGLIG